jgi:diguanylate cyclase (GGDEF)-like protein
VLALDVDDLKQVNGNLGHATSDARLVATAQVMTRVMRWGDLVARVGDDEFAAFLVHPSEEGARRTA